MQLNMNHAAAAAANLEVLNKESRIDVLLLQDLYVRDGRVVGLSSFNVFGVCKQGKIAVHRDLDGTLFMPDISSLNSAVFASVSVTDK